MRTDARGVEYRTFGIPFEVESLAMFILSATRREWTLDEYLQQPAILEIGFHVVSGHLAEFRERRKAIGGMSDGP